MKKHKATDRLLKAIHEGARDLRQAGFIDQRRMREFDALCLKPIRLQATENR
jgi:putative transcriptional regulator